MRRMTVAIVLGVWFVLAGGSGARLPAAVPGVTLEVAGTCTVPKGVPGDWDVWHELVLVEQDSWFPPHVHDGVECILTVEGTSTWWFPGDERHEVPVGRTFLVPDLVAHTAGSTRPGTMRYLSAHILRPGAPFRSEVCASAAPTNPASRSRTVFNWVFRDQAGSSRPMEIGQRLERFEPGAGYAIPASDRLVYVTALDGGISLETPDGTRVLQPNEGAPIRRGIPARLTNTGTEAARLAVLEL
jgi:hypothetical protein